MNVIISNKYQSMLQNLDIEVIKEMHGTFDVDQIISTFQNFFFSRIILDITALKNYKDIKTIQKLSIGLDTEKIILLLDDSPESRSTEYLSKLISMGIYNFSKNLDDIRYQLENPNTYRDVAHIHQLESFSQEPVAAPAAGGGGSKKVAGPAKQIQVVVAEPQGVKVIGFKDLTKQAGATTLIYMMKNVLQKSGYRVKAVEADKRDFMYFGDNDLISTTSNDIATVIAKHSNSEVILIDVNNSQSAEMVAGEMIYLLEPSMLQINRLMMLNPKALTSLKNRKIVVNKSFLKDSDVDDFAYEAKIKTFYNLPHMDERQKDHIQIRKFLIKLGFNRVTLPEDGEKKSGLFGLFK